MSCNTPILANRFHRHLPHPGPEMAAPLPIDPGVSLVRLLHDRYENTDDGPQHIQIIVSKAPRIKGQEDDGLVLPRCLGLSHQNISSVGDVAELQCLCGGVTELDIAGNLLSEWAQILSLLSAMPRLEFLNISSNRLHCSRDVAAVLSEMKPESRPTGCRVSKLILNNLQIAWADVWRLLDLLPCTQDLHLGRNDFSCVETPPDEKVFPRVKDIYLNDNNLTDWNDMLKMGRAFPELERLVLMGNPIEILGSDDEICKETFPAVKHLNLSNSQITSWEQLESLRHWPQLTELRIQNIPLLQPYDAELRLELTMAYLPTISTINGSPIQPPERERAERAFIRRYMGQDDKPRRYQELHTIYGDLDPLVKVSLDPKLQVSVAVYFKESSSIKTFNVQSTVAEVKKQLSKAFDVPLKRLLVYYRDIGAPYGDELMQYTQRTLLRYRVKDGDEFHVYDKSCS